jgi:hypothetical protein
MAIDPSIPLGARPPQIDVAPPMATLGSLALMQDRDAQVQQRRQALADQAAMQAALQTSATPDDAIDLLYKQGHANAAGLLSKNLNETRLAKANALDKSLDIQKKQVEFLSSLAGSAKNQRDWDNVYSTAASILPPGSPIMAQIPKLYDQDTQNKLVTMGMSAKDHLDLQQTALKNHNDALRLQMDQGRYNQEVQDKQRTAASQLLSSAQNQDQLDQYQQLLAGEGYDPKMLAEFGNTWSPDFPKRALKIGMTPAQQSTAAHEAVMAGQGATRNQIAQDRLDFEKAGGVTASGRPMTPGQRATAARWQQQQYRNLDKALRADPTNWTDPTNPQSPIKPDVLAQAKLGIENGYRAQIGLPSLEDAEAFYASTPGHDKDLRTIRNKFKAVTGQKAPVEQLADQLKTEQDPQKRAAILRQLSAIRSQYATGAPPAAAALPAGASPGGAPDDQGGGADDEDDQDQNE